MAWEGIDKRRFPRANYRCNIAIKRKGAPEQYSTETQNIGAGGIYVILPVNLGIFSEIEVEIFLKDNSHPVKCKGTVVWVIKKYPPMGEQGISEMYDTGIEFVDLNKADKLRVSSIVQSILKERTFKTEQ